MDVDSRCSHRGCNIMKLIVMIMSAAHDLRGEKMTQEEVIKLGLHSLTAVGVTEEEIAEATLDLTLAKMGL